MGGIRLERDRLLELGTSMGLRWRATDGRGGWASSTVLNCNTDRRDGLLLAPFRGNPVPHLFLSRFEEEIRGGGRSFPLSMARYAGTLHPAGHQFLDLFEAGPPPRTTYRIGDVSVVREVRMARGASTVLVRWTVSGSSAPEELRLRPLLPCREAGALTRENVHLDPRTRPIPGGFAARPYPSLPEVSITVSPAPRFLAEPLWHRRVEFEDGGREDQFTPGVLAVPVGGGAEVVAAASIEGPVADPAALWRREARRRAPHPAEAFLATVDGRRVVLAGSDREALIALPGLTLARGKAKEGREILRTYAGTGEAFWWSRAASLLGRARAPGADLPDPGGAVTPAAVIAASLRSSPMTRSRRAAVVDAARAELLTPRGLRTLSPRDPAYRPDAPEAGAAHPWLVGFYAEALVRAKGRTAAVRREIRSLVEGFAPAREERCLGFVSERYDGDPPHRLAGASVHAPAEGELLRALRLAGAAS